MLLNPSHKLSPCAGSCPALISPIGILPLWNDEITEQESIYYVFRDRSIYTVVDDEKSITKRFG